MRDKDVLTAAYLKNNSRFADLLNGWLFGGRPVVQPEDIQELDSAEIRIRRDRVTGGVRTGKRYRDVIRRVALGMRFAVVCVEEQSEVDYTMPFRVIGYDLDRYEQQLRIRRQEHRERKDLKAEEYLSGISREDRFLPVVTLVLYFGKHWDGPRNLKDLLDLEGMLPEVRELLADYPVHVIEVGNYPYAEAFRTDLKLVFGFVQNADDKEKLQAFARAEEEALSELAEDAYDLISREVEKINPGCDGLVMLPHLSGSLAPDVNAKAKGVWFGFSLNHTKAHFARAIMESLAFILRRNLSALKDMGITVKEVRSLGGGSKSRVWNQIKADANDITLVTVKSKEAACLGAAILAGTATGVFKSVEDAVNNMIQVKDEYHAQPEMKPVYDTNYEMYCKLFRDLTECFDRTV